MGLELYPTKPSGLERPAHKYGIRQWSDGHITTSADISYLNSKMLIGQKWKNTELLLVRDLVMRKTDKKPCVWGLREPYTREIEYAMALCSLQFAKASWVANFK